MIFGHLYSAASRASEAVVGLIAESFSDAQTRGEQTASVFDLQARRASQRLPLTQSIYTSSVAAESYTISGGAIAVPATASQRDHPEMDDKDVQRLEDRIAASEERGRLRMETIVERIDGAVTRIADQVGVIRQEIQEQRADSRALRGEVSQVTTSVRSEISSQLEAHKTTERTHFHQIIATILAVGIAAAGLIVGFGQIWGSGVQVGQSGERNIQELLHGMQNALHQIEEREKAIPHPTAPLAPQSPQGTEQKTPR